MSNPLRAGMKKISEMADLTRDWGTNRVGSTLRRSWGYIRRSFWPSGLPTYTSVDLTKTRRLYRNAERDYNLGAGFVRRIIDAIPEYMGLPIASSGDATVDEFLDGCIQVYWSGEITQIIRDACRDSRAVVRLRQHSSTNPLVGVDEREACFLELVPQESIDIYYSETEIGVIDRVFIKHEVEMLINEEDVIQGREPRTEVHVVIETITPTEYRYYDQTKGEDLTDLNQKNDWGFVPILEIFNEYDAYLKGGQSELEAPFVFLKAFHDVMAQTLAAHKTHSIPKAKFKVSDVMTFLANNFPDSFQLDENGRPISGTFSGTVSWQGTEIFFLMPEEDIEFLEAKSVLGDSKTLLDFLLECIVISSSTPRFVLMSDVSAVDSKEMLNFVKKIENKRINFQKPLQQLMKMVLKVNKMEPVVVPLSWKEIDPETLVTESQALQQTTMSLELVSQRKLVSDDTSRAYLKRYIPNMKSAAEEKSAAQGNYDLAAATATPNLPDGPTKNGAPVSGGVKG